MKRNIASKIKFYDDCYASKEDGAIYATDVLEVIELNGDRTGPEALFSAVLDAFKAGYVIGRQTSRQEPKSKR